MLLVSARAAEHLCLISPLYSFTLQSNLVTENTLAVVDSVCVSCIPYLHDTNAPLIAMRRNVYFGKSEKKILCRRFYHADVRAWHHIPGRRHFT